MIHCGIKARFDQTQRKRVLVDAAEGSHARPFALELGEIANGPDSLIGELLTDAGRAVGASGGVAAAIQKDSDGSPLGNAVEQVRCRGKKGDVELARDQRRERKRTVLEFPDFNREVLLVEIALCLGDEEAAPAYERSLCDPHIVLAPPLDPRRRRGEQDQQP